MRLFCFILVILAGASSQAYPEFIGYKYTSCLTCHYNSQGNGAINDYGRALWAAEIGGRLWAGKTSNEELGESSGFLGKTEMPYWIRPGLKMRQLWYKSNPGSSAEVSGDVLMQAEGNLALIFDESYKFLFVGSYGYAPTPRRFQGQTRADEIENWISREHYFRWQALDKLFLFVGMMDKAYGIRIVDHTAYSRSMTGIGQNDQTHGVMSHWIDDGFEVTLHTFLGNMYQDADLRQKGVSTIVEFDVEEAWRVGFSSLVSSNDYEDQKRLALHSKNGLGHGSSLLFEVGLLEDKSNLGDSMGYYIYSEIMQKIFRGYHLFATGQAYKPELVSQQADTIKTGFGMLAFPRSRYEFRVEAQNTRQILSSNQVPDDFWSLLMQVHLSL